MSTTTIFGGGIHGVGKTSMFSRVANDFGVSHLSSSELIKSVKVDAVQDGIKVAQDLVGNQDLLVQGYRRAISDKKGLILLDGHFTLVNSAGVVTDVPLLTFKNLDLKGLTCVLEKPQIIQKRLILRDGNAPSIYEINLHQVREIDAARRVAIYLGIQLMELNSGNEFDLISLVRRLSSDIGKIHQF